MTFLLALILALDWSAVRAEPNPERRSDLALQFAGDEITAARHAAGEGEVPKFQEHLKAVKAAIDLSMESLEASGKKARNNRAYKNAELKLREFDRRLKGLGEQVGFEERDDVDAVRKHAASVHEKVLDAIMSKR